MKSIARRLRNLPARAKSIATGGAAFAFAAMVAPPASAGVLADAATAAMDNAELILIGVAVLTLCGVVAMIRAGKRAAA
jgi:hypothetical protein